MIIVANPSRLPSPKEQPASLPTDSEPAKRSGVAAASLARLDVLGSATIADTVAGLGMAASQAVGAESPVLNLALAGVHGLRGAAFLAGARGKKGRQLEQRLGVALGEGLLAAGNILAGAGQSAWSIPVLLAGAALNLVCDYRYRKAYEAPPGKLTAAHWSPGQKLVNAGDTAIGLLDLGSCGGFLSNACGGLAHLGLAAACYAGVAGVASPNTHSRHSKGYGHAMIAAGMLAGAAGAGPWVLVPMLAGAVGINLQDLRDSQQRA
jgi:hypothetical protein